MKSSSKLLGFRAHRPCSLFGLPETQCLAQHGLRNFWQWHHPTFPGESTPSAVLIGALSLVRQQSLAALLSPGCWLGVQSGCSTKGCAQATWNLTTVSCTLGIPLPASHHPVTVVLLPPGHVNPVSGGCTV